MKEIPIALSYDDVLLKPQYSEVESRKKVNLETNITPNIKLGLPITSSNMDTVTGTEMCITMHKKSGISFYPRFEKPETQAETIKNLINEDVLVIPSVGIKKEELRRAELLIKAGAKTLVVDVAHGHMKTCLDFVKQLKNKFTEVEIIAGNVATYEGSKSLFKAGADCVKVGVGPGSICTTRIVTGSGVPQLTAVMEASKAAKEVKKHVIADGGIKNSGDIVKALAAGAHAVMLGNVLAGTKESPGNIVKIGDKEYKQYNGSTSKAEKKKYAKVEDIEGVEGLVPYKGTVLTILESLKQGIKSGLSYSGAFNLKEFHNKAEFVRITSGGLRESGAHDIVIK